MGTNITPEEMESLAKRNPLAFGIAYVDLLDGKSWSLSDRKWVKQLYQVANPFDIEQNPIDTPRRVCFTKSTQAGISTLSIVRALHFMSFWTVRVMMMLPRQKDLSDFSSTRLDPIIANSKFLSSRLGDPNSVYTKKVGNSYIFFIEGSVEPRSMPADALFLDEVDLCNPDHVGTAINRLDASSWRLITYLSTPTLPNYGIDAVYQSSDMREWIVPCPHCGHRQPLDWEKNLAVVGPANNPTSVYYHCVNCGKELTLENIQEGEWIPQHPYLSKDLVGFHISQMMTTPAPKLYALYRDPQQSLSEFYRKRLGKPYTMAGGSLDREDFLLNCFEEPYDPEKSYDGKSTYYMGVDQGNQLQVVVVKVPPGKRAPKVVHIELVPFEEGFARVAELIRLYKVRRAVIDGDPNRHPVKDLQKTFPAKVLMADYIEQRERFVVKKDEKKIPTHVTINRTEGFDDLVASIRKGYFSLPGDPTNLPPVVETLIDQMTSIKRDIEKRKTPSGEIEVGVWRKLRADHLAHSMLYAKTAIDIDHGKGFRVAVVGSGGSEAPAEQAEQPKEKAYAPKPEVVASITALFAEVPNSQIAEYLERKDAPDYQAPFPLRYKLKRAQDNYTAIDIEWVMTTILKIGY